MALVSSVKAAVHSVLPATGEREAGASTVSTAPTSLPNQGSKAWSSLVEPKNTGDTRG